MSKLKVDAISSIDFTGDSDSILLENDGSVQFNHDTTFQNVVFGSDSNQGETSGVVVFNDRTVSGGGATMTTVTFSDGIGGGGVISMKKARGSQVAPEAVQDGDIVAGLYAWGYDSSGFRPSSAARFKVDGTVSSYDVPIKFTVETNDSVGTIRERFVVNADGTADFSEHVRINGTSSDSSTISGEILSVKPAMKVWNSTGGAAIYLEDANLQTTSMFQVNDDDAFAIYRNGSEKMRITNSGDVGIGSTNPVEKLSVVGDINLNPESTSSSDRLSARYIGKRDAGTSGWMANVGFEGSASNGFATDIVFSSKTGDFYNSATTEKMRITSAGKVGIGTDDPWNSLTVRDGTYPTLALGDSSGQMVYLQRNAVDNGSAFLYNKGTGSFLFGTDNTERMRITSSGNVGIGHTSPDKTLVVSGDGAEIVIDDTDTTDTPRLRFRESGATSGSIHTDGSALILSTGTSSRMTIDASGNIGINLSQPVAVNAGRVVEGMSTTGFEYVAGNSTLGTVGGEFIGAYLFRNSDTSGTQPHYAGMWAEARDQFGFMHLHFAAGRDKYETDSPHMTIEGEFGNVVMGAINQSGNAKLQVSAAAFGTGSATLGTLNDHTPLYVTGSDTTYGLVVGNSSSTGNVYMQAQRTDGTATAYDIMLNPEGGNVGIGTTHTAPVSQLHLQQTLSNNESATYITLENRNGSGASANAVGIDFYAGASITSSANRRARILALGSISGGHIDLAFHVSKNSAGYEAMRIDEDGNVGIGTTNPSSPLTINSSNSSIFRMERSSNTVGFSMSGAASGGWGLYDYARSEYDIFMKNGNVGIGTTTPSGILHTRSVDYGVVFQSSQSVHNRMQLFFQDYLGSTTGIIAVDKDGDGGNAMSFNTGSSEKMRIDNSGHVAIGSPSSLSPWRTTDSVVQIGTRTSVTQLSVDTHLTNNGYFSQTSGWFAQDTAKCSNYYQSD
jgi:hypothetical protein